MSAVLNLALNYNQSLDDFLKINHPEIRDYRILAKSLDARNANKGRIPKYQYRLEVLTDKNQEFESGLEAFGKLSNIKHKPIIVGAGPAGLFCALRLIEFGIPSIVIERGERAEKRMLDIAKFWRYGVLNEENNVCYGEGGAGLFSDGKLITRVKSPFIKYVMKKFVEFGAPEEVEYLANPHLGSNKIRSIINKMTDFLIAKGCEFHYNTRVDDFIFEGKQIVGVKTNRNQVFHAPHVVLAIGHSAYKTFQKLNEHKVEMKRKSFAVGVRIEHPRSVIDSCQYGDFSQDPSIGAARYRLAWNHPVSKKGTYSFCMCPGGYVLSSGTEKNGIVVNGMSNYSRSSRWSNSALVVSVEAGKDFGIDSESVLDGFDFQHSIEKKAYETSTELASGRELPAQTLESFLNKKKDKQLPITSSPSKIFSANIKEILPDFIGNHLEKALLEFDKKLPGFNYKKALLIAPETRTSSPVTVLRDRETYESTSHQGLYPAGEGAGYAGGITSAAVDGVNIAMSIVSALKNS